MQNFSINRRSFVLSPRHPASPNFHLPEQTELSEFLPKAKSYYCEACKNTCLAMSFTVSYSTEVGI